MSMHPPDAWNATFIFYNRTNPSHDLRQNDAVLQPNRSHHYVVYNQKVNSSLISADKRHPRRMPFMVLPNAIGEAGAEKICDRVGFLNLKRSPKMAD